MIQVLTVYIEVTMFTIPIIISKERFFLFVRYLSSEQVLDIKPHGNSKTEEPYFRTSTNTIKSLKSNLKSASPKEALEKVSTERGGEMSAKSVGSLPRNHQQVYKTT